MQSNREGEVKHSDDVHGEGALSRAVDEDLVTGKYDRVRLRRSEEIASARLDEAAGDALAAVDRALLQIGHTEARKGVKHSEIGRGKALYLQGALSGGGSDEDEDDDDDDGMVGVGPQSDDHVLPANRGKSSRTGRHVDGSVQVRARGQALAHADNSSQNGGLDDLDSAATGGEDDDTVASPDLDDNNDDDDDDDDYKSGGNRNERASL